MHVLSKLADMWPRFGIKIGNSTLCIASAKVDGNIDVIANKQGDRVSQACLLWDGGNEIECGLTAQQKITSRPKQGAANSFQFLVPHEELTSEKIETATKEITCGYDADNHQFELRVDKSDVDEPPTLKISPFDIHVNLLKSEFELARQFLGNDGDQKPSVVLSIPSYYTGASWPLLAQAAEEAGFHVAQIITEHTAAVLAYGIGEMNNETDDLTQPTESKYVLSIKCGGLFSHFALYELTNGLYKVLDSRGPFCIGGKQYTEALVQFICEEFHRKYKLDPHESRRSMTKIRTAAANCKHILTTLQSTQIYIDSLMDGVDFNMQMSLARFESIIKPVINSFLQRLNEAIDKMFQLTNVKKIDEIVLLGGTMRIPKLQSAISTRCPEAKLNVSLAADEVVAIGCARQATFLTDPEGQDLQLTEECVCVDTDAFIWHETNEGNARILLRKGTLLPSVVTVDIEIDALKPNEPVDDGVNIFHIKVGDEVSDVPLKEATATAEGVFKIEADVSLVEQENSRVKTPVIKLRCL